MAIFKTVIHWRKRLENLSAVNIFVFHFFDTHSLLFKGKLHDFKELILRRNLPFSFGINLSPIFFIRYIFPVVTLAYIVDFTPFIYRDEGTD